MKLRVAWLGLLLSPALGWGAALSSLMGEPPSAPEEPLPPSGKVLRDGSQRTGDFGPLAITDKSVALAFFHSVYDALSRTPIEWTGNGDTCDAGDTSADFKAAVLTRVNWFRAMAGVPDGVVFDIGPGSYSDKAQDAALIMSANGRLDHYPDATMTCYTTTGAEAARSSNLSLGHNGWDAVTGQMMDDGASNTAVGHRRWILYPQTRVMGTGDIPEDDVLWSANALWVFDDHYNDPRPTTRDTFVAWPPPGYVPDVVVPARWSFSLPDADFGSASVTVKRNGTPVSVALEPLHDGYGENTLVWRPEGASATATGPLPWQDPQTDLVYEVSIQGVREGGRTTQYDYQVIVTDPDDFQPSSLGVRGPETLLQGSAGQFQYDTLDWAEGHRLRIAAVEPYGGDQGAENGADDILDGTNEDYALISSATSASGLLAFHLVHTTPDPQYFEWNRTFLLAADSELSFASRVGFVTTNEVPRVQISFNEGASWQDLDAGWSDGGESQFTTRRIPLGSHAGRTARFRFLFDIDCSTRCSYYPDPSTAVGWWIDDIRLTQVEEMGATELRTLDGSGTFSHTPTTTGTYVMQVQAVPWEGFPGLGWGELHRLQVEQAASSQCGSAVVILTQAVDCSATSRLVIQSGLVVESGQTVRVSAPEVVFGSGFRVRPGAVFVVARP